MEIQQIREKFLNFYKTRGHKIIPSASIVPENDPTTLFTGSGMQPLIPYLLGAKHPDGTRLVNSQKSFRTVDIEDVGDNRHTTFFEMLGNWSLGEYFKKEQLPWVFEFLTDEIGLDPKKIYVTVFIGDEENKLPRDTESVEIWKELFAKKSIEAKDVEMGSENDAAKLGMRLGRIFYYNVKKNWWSRSGTPSNMPAGEPGGPDSEIFYEFSDVEHDNKYGENCHPNCDCGRYLEIGNSVFMEYQKQNDGTFSKLPQRNVDFGGGLERIAMVSENNQDIFMIDVFKDLISHIESLSGKTYKDKTYTQAFRVIADHMRSSIFLIGAGITPSNTDRGYFVRRLLRRAITYWDKLGITTSGISEVADVIIDKYKDTYQELETNRSIISTTIQDEETKFRHTLVQGLKEFEKISSNGTVEISGKDAFTLFSSYGFPFELILELAKDKNVKVNIAEYQEENRKHQDMSRAGSEKKFKGGLADSSEQSVRYHTATHLLNAGLRKVLGDHVVQKGSNITPERLRFDFMHSAKMTDAEKKSVEDYVNDAISRKIKVSMKEMDKDEALKSGAVHAFNEKYGDIVSVYTVGDDATGVISREFCGGPHVSNTGELAGPDSKWKFKIQKEEAVAAGVRRIKAILE